MNSNPQLQVITGRDNPALVAQASRRIGGEWPEFMLHDPVADNFPYCYENLPEYQFILLKQDENEPIAIGNSIPLAWNESLEDLPDDGWDWAMTTGVNGHRAGRRANLLCALQIVVFRPYRGQGISRLAVEAMRAIGRARGLAEMIAPVRPNRKHEFPRVPIAEYIKRRNNDDRPFDPWLRVHFDLGARIIKPCPMAMTVTGTVAEWEEWTGLHFPTGGEYIVPDALVPVIIDRESDRGEYIEPNVWMHHPAETRSGADEKPSG
jgi:GNAT superfamily N-acetyltransferase